MVRGASGREGRITRSDRHGSRGGVYVNPIRPHDDGLIWPHLRRAGGRSAPVEAVGFLTRSPPSSPDWPGVWSSHGPFWKGVNRLTGAEEPQHSEWVELDVAGERIRVSPEDADRINNPAGWGDVTIEDLERFGIRPGMSGSFETGPVIRNSGVRPDETQ